MLWPKNISYKEFDNKKKILQLPAARKFPSPPPPITFLMVRPLPRLAMHNRGERCVTSLKTAAKETILIPNVAHNTAGTRERIGGLEMDLSGLK